MSMCQYTSWTYRTAPGPFGLILNADGTYYAFDYVMEEINWNGYWEYVGGKLYIDGEEFTVATSSDGTISFFSENASIY